MADISKIELNGIIYDVKDSQARSESEQATSDVSALDTRVETVEGKVSTLEGNVSTAQSDILGLKQKDTALESDVAFLKTSNDRLASTSNQHTVQINSLNSAVEDNDSDISELQRAVNGQDTRIDAISDSVAGVTASVGAVSNDIDELSARMDEFTNLPEGSTTGDAELADIRVGFNGVTYSNAGNAVREQDKAILLEAISESTVNVLNPYYLDGGTTGGGNVTVTRNKDTYHVSGTATANGFRNMIVMDNALPEGVKPGDQVIITRECEVANSSLRVEIFYNTTGSGSDWIYASGFNEQFNGLITYTLPSGIRGLLIRLDVYNGTSYNADIRVKMLKSSGKRSFNEKGVLPNGSLNNVIDAGYYLMVDNHSYTEMPYGSYLPGFLEVIPVDTAILQRYTPWGTNKIYARRNLRENNWGDWSEITGGGSGQTINNIYENTYSVVASPEITSDTNNYLAPSGDNSDRTMDVVTMLTQNGVCRLGGGDYYVANLVMPDNTAIIGSGNKTRIILGSGDFAIKLGSYCTVKDLSIHGSLNNITPSVTVGSKHGILWQGTYSVDESSPKMSVIENVLIKNFNGGGICCDNTGYPTDSCIHVSDCYIVRCDCGIYIKYWSEFNKFENVSCKSCYYGCINNGGNNMFADCDFSSNSMGLLMDNQNNQSPNNSHGSYVGCVFNHSGSNEGYGVQILNCDAGTVFDGCQIFFSKLKFVNSDGVLVSNCNFGVNNCNLEIDGGGAILFLGNMHQGIPTISINNNSKVVFANCYVRSTGAVVSA